MKVGAIIVAAGAGRRMKADRPKQFLAVDGVPILVHTLRKFDACPLVDFIVVAVPRDAVYDTEALLQKASFRKPIALVEGGQRRQDSTAAGLRHLQDGTTIVVVHDAVRPFVRVQDISAVIEEAERGGAAILALPIVDTVKQVGRELVESTVPREHLVLAQTPQAFRLDVLTEAFRRGEQDGYYATDESGLVERLGKPVRLVRGFEYNIKITRPSDLSLARFLMEQENRSE